MYFYLKKNPKIEFIFFSYINNTLMTDYNITLERILLANTVVVGAGYNPDELPRLEKNHPNYVGIGGKSNDDLIPQLDFFGFQAINIGGEETANLLLDMRAGRKFEFAVVDRCVFNYFITTKPHPTSGFIPNTNQLNGYGITVIDQNCFGIKFLQRVLVPGATIYFHDEVENFNIELETLLPGTKILENVGDSIVPRIKDN